MTHLQALCQYLFNIIEGLGALGSLVFVPLYILGTLIFVPNPILALAAGALFGVPIGFLLVSVSSTLSAGGIFLAGRSLSRKWVLKKIALNKKTKVLDDAVTKEGWKMVALLRQTAILPFSIMNYALGLSKITFKNYVLASWIGMMPGQILYVYLGSIAGEIALKGHQRQKTLAEWLFLVLGLIVTIGISVRATLVVKKALRTHHLAELSAP